MIDAEIKAREDEKARLDTAENRGRSEGIAEGIIEGRLSAILDLVKDKILTVSQASQRLGKTEEEIQALLR